MDHEPPEPEKVAAIRKIRRLMDFWQIDPHELNGVVLAAPRRKAPVETTRYRHPVTGESWDGLGTQPDWLRAALLREGYTVDELRIAPGVADPVQTAGHAPDLRADV